MLNLPKIVFSHFWTFSDVEKRSTRTKTRTRTRIRTRTRTRTTK